MKKISIIFLLAVIYILSVNAQQWVNFSSSEPSVPEMNLLTSNAQTVTFSVTIPGIYTQDTVIDAVSFTRLILPGGGAINPAGSPELPVLAYRVAIPYCDNVEVDYRINSNQTMPSCWVYPVPEMVPDGNGYPAEQFTFNPAVYVQPRAPEPTSSIFSSGSFRTQRYVEVMVCPVEFCPVNRTLSVIDKIEITLNFNAPRGDIRQNMGIFNKIAAATFINYEDNGISASINDKAYKRKRFTPGNVNWITLTDTAQACQIPGDYLIITVPEFFDENNPNSQLKRLAEHRAFYNGYDVAIVNVENILSLPFFFEGIPSNPNDTTYIKEQKMRTFIRRVYEGKNAHHFGGDTCLAYVLLVGDNYKNSMGNNEGMPVSWDHNVAYINQKYPSDFYFSCMTSSGSIYGDLGDLFIGRFSVEDTTHLYNMVQKTIYHETELNPEPWRQTAAVTYGEYFTGSVFGEAYRTLFLNFMSKLLNEKGWSHDFVYDEPIRKPTLNYLNVGVVYAQYIGGPYHNVPTGWEDNLIEDTLSLRLNNEYKAPFIHTIYCHTSHFDNYDCYGEFITRFSPTKGAVGYVGASRAILTGHNHYIDTVNLRVFQENFPYFLFRKNISIAGELLLIAKNKLGLNISTNIQRHGYSLLGDPALNILATEEEGCEKNLHTTLVVDSETIIDCNRYCDENVSIIVQPGAKLIIDGATITNISGKGMWEGITVLGDMKSKGVVELINGATIENAKIGIHSIDGGWMKTDNACFMNNAISVQIDPEISSFIVAKPINFINTQFVVNDSYFGNVNNFGSHVKLSNSITVKVLGCKFSNENSQLSYSNIGNNTGIWAFNSPVIVDNYVINSVTTPTEFSGFYVALFSINSGNSPLLSIENSEFVNNVHGIRINTVDYPQVKNNNFDLSIVDASGVNTVDVTGYQISENNFLNPNPSPLNSSTGMRIMKSGSGENVVYNNHFSKLNVGILASDRNSSQGSSNLPGFVTGLQFLCNHFEDIKQADILVGDPSQLADHSIRREQGSSIQPAGNKFINNQPPRVNIGNNSNYRIYYYYSSGVPEENPLYVSGSVDKTSSNYPTGCPGKSGRNLEYELAQYDKWNAEYELWLDKLLATKVGSEEYYVILNEVSYFSGLKDNFYNSILVAAINNKEIDEENKGKFENLRYLFGYRGNYTDYLSITETYLAESNFEEAITTLAKMYKQFEVTEKQMLELKGMETYALWLQQLEKERNSIYKLSEKELDYLVKYVETNTGRGAVFANNILCALYNICLEEEKPKYIAPQNQTEEETTIISVINNTLQIDDKVLLYKITIIPNPTTGELRVTSYELQIDNIDFFDVYGRKVSSHNFPPLTSHSSSLINISNLNNGIYFVKIATTQGEIVKKVVKQ